MLGDIIPMLGDIIPMLYPEEPSSIAMGAEPSAPPPSVGATGGLARVRRGTALLARPLLFAPLSVVQAVSRVIQARATWCTPWTRSLGCIRLGRIRWVRY